MIYRIAKFEIDTLNFSITESGEAVAVEPKVFDLIVYLIKHREHLISRDELFAQIWSGREVTDTTLSNHIKSARKIFGDNGEQQQVIKTIRGRGYQFIALVNEVDTTSTHQQPSNTISATLHSTPSEHRFRFVISHLNNKKRLLASLGLLVLLSILYVWQSVNTVEKIDQRPYLIVVPFDISSTDNVNWQPFTDQVTREVIRKLSHISGLRVLPASSAFTFKQNKTHDYIQQQLPEVGYVIDAVVNINGEGDMRVTADLTELTTGNVIWGDHYQSRVDDTNFFAIQSDIANSVSESLEIAILEKEKNILRELPTANLAAYELYISGQQQLNLLTQQSLLESITLFSQAIALDPKFEAAYIAKADAFRIIMSYFDKPVDVLPKVVTAVLAALDIQPNSAEALSSLGLAYVFAWRWQDAWKVLNAAKQHNPNLALTELGFALYYSALGDQQGVTRALARANQLDPLNIELADWGHWALAMVGDLDGAITWSNNQIRLHPDVGMIYSGASVSASLKNQHQRAVSLAQTGVQLDPTSPYALLALAQAYGYAGQADKIPTLLKQAEQLGSYMCPYETAINFMLLNDIEQAFEQLNDAVSYRSNCLVFTRVDRRLSPLHKDSRFSAILTRVGLDDAAIATYPR